MTAAELVAAFMVNLRGALRALNESIREARPAFRVKRGRGQRRNRRHRK